MGQTETSKSDPGVLNHLCAILDCFTMDTPELGVREVSRMTGLSSSTAGRMMTTMREKGILSQNPDTRSYTLGVKILAWAGVYLSSSDLRNVALPIMTELQVVTQETISLYQLDGKDRVCIERLESPQNVRIVTRVGKRLPLYAGSAGKAILAFLPEKRREAILAESSMEPLTAHTITDLDVLRAELERIRKLGYSVSHGEWIIDASGVAAPIYGPDRDVIGAISISGPSQRFGKEKIDHYASEVVRTALMISRQMGYRG